MQEKLTTTLTAVAGSGAMTVVNELDIQNTTNVILQILIGIVTLIKLFKKQKS